MWQRPQLWGHARPRLLLLALWLRVALAPVPCGPELLLEVTVGDMSGYIGFSRTFEHDTFEERHCSILNPGYEGNIIVGCTEGELNATVDGCSPGRCLTYLALSVAIGESTASVSPLATILSGGMEERLCRELNPLYRRRFILYCNYGALTVDISECVPQYDIMQEVPWEPRARHAAVTMGDGALLLMGGLGERGPLREVWQWSPIGFWEAAPLPPYRDPLGTWEQPWAVPLPPWSGRYGAAAVWQVRESGEQVTLIGGNDNLNRNDVWRWLRYPSLVRIPLDDSDPTGTQPEDCSLLVGPVLQCSARSGVSGRRWYISKFLQPSTEVHLELRHTGVAGQGGAAVIALQLGHCRQVFQLVDGFWSTYGCSGDDPPWAQPASPRPLGPGGWRAVRLVLDRELHQVQLHVDGHAMPPVWVSWRVQEGLDMEEACRQEEAGALGRIEDVMNATACGAQGDVTMQLLVVDVAVWPSSTLEVRGLSVLAPAGYWEQLVESAPWEPRSTHAAVALPDGDILLLGGLGDSSLLNDVWRWTPKSCTLLPDMSASLAVQFALQCSYPCSSSRIYGQWARLPNAPWAPRQEHAAVWTSAGVLVLGGRTATGFENDIWRWTYSEPFCSLAWEGRWEQLTPAASWPPRVGHSVVGFTPLGSSAAETVLLFGGFGGYAESEHVSEQVLRSPIQMRNDIWCGNIALGNFSSWLELAPYSPFSARTQASMLAAPTLGSYAMLFFGGYDRNARFTADFWRWSGENATAACKVEID